MNAFNDKAFQVKASKELSGMILADSIGRMQHDFRNELREGELAMEEFDSFIMSDALSEKENQIESCWEWHTDPEGAFDRAERRYWAEMPCKPLY